MFLDWFQNPKNINESVFDKITASLVSEKKVPKHFYSILRITACVEMENKWFDDLNVLDEVDWNGIHMLILIVPSKPNYVLFILNFFIGPFAQTNFFSK